MDEDGGPSSLSALVARIEAYVADPDSFSIPGPSTRHELWLPDPELRISASTQLADELTVLESIYTPEAIHLLRISPLSSEISSSSSTSTDESLAEPQSWLPGSKITLSISTDVGTAQGDEEGVPIRLAVTLPPFYPHSQRPPQLQLLSRYVGGFSVDTRLFGEILRAFYHQTEEEVQGEEEDAAKWVGGSMDRGVNWVPGEVVLFEGIEWVKEKVSDWWREREAERLASAPAPASSTSAPANTTDEKTTTFSDPSPPIQPAPFTGKLFRTEPIIERKSEFIGYAAALTSPDQVPSILSHILSDKRVARATHPIINAWVCKSASNGVVHRDCDDDGETAAGGRLAHLLSILELENVIVVVTRWYGGVHLGADRFKLINRAAREALDLGGFIGKNAADDGGRGKGMGKRNS